MPASDSTQRATNVMKKTIIATFAGLGWLSACSVLPPAQPPLATLKLYPVPSAHVLTLAEVDGAGTSDGDQAQVIPGAHRIAVSLRPPTADRPACTLALQYANFEAGQVYGIFEGDWNGAPTLFLKGARGEILDSRKVAQCALPG